MLCSLIFCGQGYLSLEWNRSGSLQQIRGLHGIKALNRCINLYMDIKVPRLNVLDNTTWNINIELFIISFFCNVQKFLLQKELHKFLWTSTVIFYHALSHGPTPTHQTNQSGHIIRDSKISDSNLPSAYPEMLLKLSNSAVLKHFYNNYSS